MPVTSPTTVTSGGPRELTGKDPVEDTNKTQSNADAEQGDQDRRRGGSEAGEDHQQDDEGSQEAKPLVSVEVGQCGLIYG